jgi:RNA polymerase sigma-70 factor (ECF subfamily)
MSSAGPSVSEALAHDSAHDVPERADPHLAAAVSPLSPPEQARLAAMVHAHHAFVWRSLRRLGVLPGDVDDAAQKVFLTVARKLSDIGAAQERPFLFATSVRIASNARRAQSRVRHELGEDLTQVESLARSPESESADRELLDQLLSPLPLELRGPFILFELEQMTTQEIAELLEIPVGTAASRLRRARELVLESIQRHEARSRRENGGAR